MRKDLLIPGGKRRFLHSLLLLFLIFLGVPLILACRGWDKDPLFFQILFLAVLGGSFFLWERTGNEPPPLKKIFAFPEQGKRIHFLLFSLLAGIILQLAVFLLNLFAGKLFTLLHIPFEEQHLVTFLKTLPPGRICFFFFPVLFLAPLVEEWVFRHTVYREAEKEFSPLTATLWQGGAFAFVHFNAVTFPGLLLLGLFLGWNVKRCRTLWGGILPHFFFNLAGMILLLLERSLLRQPG